MLPKPHDVPAGSLQRAVDKPVTRLVSGQFPAPERTVGFGFCSMPGTAVPEATVNEYRQPMRPENEVRFSEHPLVAPPSGDAVVP